MHRRRSRSGPARTRRDGDAPSNRWPPAEAEIADPPHIQISRARPSTQPLHGPPGCEIHPKSADIDRRSEEHTSELQSLRHLVCRLLLEKKYNNKNTEVRGSADAGRPVTQVHRIPS